LIDTGGPGGAETVFLELVTGLDARGWDQQIVVPVRDWLHAELRTRGLEALVLASDGSFDVGYLRHLRHLVTSRSIELIQTHLFGSAVYASLATGVRAIPVVSTFHGSADVAPDERYRRVKFRVVRRPRNRFVFVSDALRRWFIDTHAMPESQCRVVHNGISLDGFLPRSEAGFRNEIGVPEGALLVGAIGNLRRPKRYDIFLKAASLLRKRSSRYRFVIVGEGSGGLREELIELRRELDLDDVVTFAGFARDIDRVLASLDVYCTSSSFEGFSLTTLEAIAAGVPVVATRCGGPEEIVEEGRSGLLVAPESPEALADGIDRIVALESSGGVIEHRRRASVERFTLDAMVEGYLDVYAECIGPVPVSA